MQNLIKTPSLFIILFLFVSCKKDRTFPPATDTGAGHFAWIANGNQRICNPSWGPGGYTAPWGFSLSYKFPFSPGFYLHGGSIYSTYGLDIVAFQADSLTLNSGQTYTIGKAGTPGIIAAQYNTNLITAPPGSQSDTYDSNDDAGQLVITRYDVQNGIVSGTFSFNAYDAKGNKMEVRSGRFDFKYGNQ